MKLSQYIPQSYSLTIYDIDYQKYLQQGIKALFFDLDNTIIDYDQTSFTPEIVEFIKNLQQTFKVVVVSNSRYPRVSKACAGIVDYVPSALKPLKKGYKKALKIAGVNASEVLVIGDQIMTDIKGSANMAMSNVLVQPIATKTEKIWTLYNRRREKKIIEQIKLNYPESYQKVMLPYESRK